jgi:hypothetical protein
MWYRGYRAERQRITDAHREQRTPLAGLDEG